MKTFSLTTATLLISLSFALAQADPDQATPAPPAPARPRSLPSGRAIERAPAPTSPAAPTTPDTTPESPAPPVAPTVLPPAIDPTTGLPIPANRRAVQQIDPNTGLPITANTNPLANGALEEEGNLNLDAAMTSYKSVISRFDGERPEAANAIFRLGECYRKLGRIEEAKVQYARILREFADQADLVKLSERHLFEPTPQQARFQQRLQAVVRRAPEKQVSEKDARFVKEQIDLIQSRIDELQKNPRVVDSSSQVSKELFDLRIQLIHLKDQLAAREEAEAAATTGPASVEKLEERLAAARASLAELMGRYKESHPFVMEQRAKINSLEQQLARIEDQPAAMERGPSLSGPSPTPATNGGNVSNHPPPGRANYSPGAVGYMIVKKLDAASTPSPVAEEKALIQEQIKLVRKKLAKQEDMRKQNLTSDDAIDEVKMQLLSLERDLATWETKNTARDTAPPAAENSSAERHDPSSRKR
jgi:tetratricopeptide (TPR) repeat protein